MGLLACASGGFPILIKPQSMLNRLTNVLAHSASSASDGRFETDAQPGFRLIVLAGGILLPLIAIGVRVAYLQTATAEQFAKPFEQTFVSYESVPSRDGRLLSADGRVLATDRRQFTVQVHYRWLEEPADPAWLRAQALSRLSRKDRRDSNLIAQKQREILAQREAMWDRLSQLSGTSLPELTKKRSQIQHRVEGIVKLVEEKRRQKFPIASKPVLKLDSWRSAWDKFSQSVTTPPERQYRDPVIIKEEQDYHPLLTGIRLAAVAEIESHPAHYPGLKIETLSWRDYPQDRLAAHLVGVRKPLTAEDAEKRKARFAGPDPLGYEVGDRLGRMGLEQMYDHHLHGLRGKRKIVRNRRGEIVQTELLREPRGGRDLVLTINANLQERLEQLLDQTLAAGLEDATKPKSAGASLVVMDIRTGAVVAAVSAPRFSLQDFLHPTPEEWQAMTADPRRPFFHRAVNMAVAPGSIFKPVTAVALLESGKFDPDESRYCQGFLDRPDQHRCFTYRHFGVGHGDLTLSHAICRSCNVYFFQGARKIGPHFLVHWAQRFGIGRETGIDLPGEQAGNLPKPPMARRSDDNSRVQPVGFSAQDSDRKPWYPGDTLGLAIGQSRLTVTPLQMVRMMAAIANDGYLLSPHLVQGFGPSLEHDKDAARAISIPEPQPIPGLTEGTLARIREGLEMVVAHPKGTGYKTVRMPNVKIAGKTGTAEVGGTRPDHAWFAGYVPADRPKFAFAIILEHAGSGGKNAGPIAKQTVETLLDLGLITGHTVRPEQ